MVSRTRTLLFAAWLLFALIVQYTPVLVATVHARSCDKPLADIYQEISPYVVIVSSITIDPFDLSNRVVPSVGSGLFVDDRGNIVTNYHVVAKSQAISVAIDSTNFYQAEFVGGDPLLDLAVIRVRRGAQFSQAPRFADSDKIRIGDEVIAIGNPFGVGKTLTRGVVSGINRLLRITSASWLSPFIQTDAAINPGNSGGPLVDRCGEVIGINTLASTMGENLGFAIPSNVVKATIKELIQDGRVIRAWHGIYGRMIDASMLMLLNIPLTPGFLIETIEPGSAAARAGLRAGSLPVRIGAQEFILGGDIITHVNGVSITDLESALMVVSALKVDQKIKVDYFRGGENYSVEVVLAERPILPSDLRSLHGRRQRN